MTVSATQVLRNTSRALTPQNLQINGFLKFTLQSVQFIHRIYTCFRKVNLYSAPNNFLKMVAGHTVNWLVGNQTAIRIAAQSVLIGARITDLIKAQKSLVHEVRCLKNTLFNRFAIYPKISRKEIQFRKNISPSTHYYFKVKIKIIKVKFFCTIVHIKIIIKGVFIISMKTIDALTSFCYGDESASSNVNEIFVNSSKCLRELTNNKQLLLDTIKKNKTIIAVLFSNMSSLFTIDQIIASIETSLHFASKVSSGVENMSEKVGELIKETFKHTAFGLFQTAGLTEIIPNSWVPKIEIHKESIEKSNERYPLKNQVSYSKN